MGDVERAAQRFAPRRFLRQHVRATEVNEDDAGGHQQQMAVRGVGFVDGLQGLLQVVDSAEKQGAVDAHDFELRAVGQAGIGAEHGQGTPGHRFDILHTRLRCAAQIQQQGQTRTAKNRVLQLNRKGCQKRQHQNSRLLRAGTHDEANGRHVNQTPGHHK